MHQSSSRPTVKEFLTYFIGSFSLILPNPDGPAKTGWPASFEVCWSAALAS
jgi:hypothetical protein